MGLTESDHGYDVVRIVEIDHGHDQFYVSVARPDPGWGEAKIVLDLNSTGSFKVAVEVSGKDALALADALREAAGMLALVDKGGG